METKNGLTEFSPCTTCLCTGRKLRKITDERLNQYYLDAVNEIPLSHMATTCPDVCWECEALLKKCVSFREQIKDCCRILLTYTAENLSECLLTEVSRPSNLALVTINDNIDIKPSIEIEVTTLNYASDKLSTSEVQTVFVKDEAPCEWDGDRLDTKEDISPLLANSVKDVDRLAHGQTDTRAKDGPVRNGNINEAGDVAKKTSWTLRSTARTKKLRECSPKSNHEKIAATHNTANDIDVKDEESIDIDNNDWNHYDNTSTSEGEAAGDDLVSSKTDSELNVHKIKSENKLKKKFEKKILAKVKRKRNCLKNGDSKEKITKPQKKQHQKIRNVELSYEEMLAERASQSASLSNCQYKCDSCQIGFAHEASFKHHVKSKHDSSIGDFTCSVCSTVLATLDSLTSHTKRHLKRYECTECGKRTTDRRVLLNHFDTTHLSSNSKEYTCNICGKVSNSIDTHRYHRDSHKSRVECSQCDKTFSHRAGLMNHIFAVHKKNNDFPCSECGRSFRWKTSLRKHMDIHERKTKIVAWCTPCEVSFTSVCSYKRHLRNSLKHVTQDQLKFICDHCKKRFSNKTKLRDHIEEKHLHRTYHCHICMKPSKNRVCLDQHIRNVHRGRPHNKMCHHCGKGFPTKIQLESHIRSHTGERPFICEFCPTTFSQQSNLYKHNRQVHLNIKSKRYTTADKKDDAGNRTQEPSMSNTEVNQVTLPEGFL